MEFIFESVKGKRININNGEIRTIKIDGLSPEAVINMSELSGHDGAAYVSSQKPKRNIIMLLDLLGNIEANRLLIYDIFRVGQMGTFYYKSDYRDVKIACYAEKTPYTLDSSNSEIQISLLCPQPYFTSLTPIITNLSIVTPLFEFPFTLPEYPETFRFSDAGDGLMKEVINNSDVDIDMKIIFTASSALRNPSLLNVNTKEFFKLDFEMLANDVITVDSDPNQYSITLTRNGVDTDIFNSLAEDSTFLLLYSGRNLFRWDSDSNLNGLHVQTVHEEYFSGV